MPSVRTSPQVGEPAPWFACRSPVNPRFKFDTVAGRQIVLCFFGTSSNDAARQTLDEFIARRAEFDDVGRCFFGVSNDPQDESRLEELLPGTHLFWDFDGEVSRLYGVAADASTSPRTFVLDERLRIHGIVASSPAPRHVDDVLRILNELSREAVVLQASIPAPVLVVPRIFEPDLCRALIAYYAQHGGEESGFMRDVDGKTVSVHDYRHKRRRDQEIVDESLRIACLQRIRTRLVPEIHKAFQFHATRIERYIVACYESSVSGHFRPHRDNTTKGTAHRRFAVSLNLNTHEYDGGMLRFPEFGARTYEAPAGGAVVFSCSLLHEATPVTAGTRYVFLPFLYDDEAARIRQENLRFLG